MARTALAALVEDLNRAWLDGRWGDLAPLVDAEVVLLTPDGERVTGREAFVASYRDFARRARVRSFAPGEPKIDVWGDTAMASCPFHIVYEAGGDTHDESGTDLLLLARSTARNGGWRVVWRTMLPHAAVGAAAEPAALSA
jgi:ketosteroid isomerase-like protein